jgi:hypothetical protein
MIALILILLHFHYFVKLTEVYLVKVIVKIAFCLLKKNINLIIKYILASELHIFLGLDFIYLRNFDKDLIKDLKDLA